MPMCYYKYTNPCLFIAGNKAGFSSTLATRDLRQVLGNLALPASPLPAPQHIDWHITMQKKSPCTCMKANGLQLDFGITQDEQG
jgi:hypothetical protein